MRLIALLFVLLSTAIAMPAAEAASLSVTASGYRFTRFEAGAFAPTVLKLKIRSATGSVRFRIDGLPAFLRSDRTSGRATTDGTVVSLTVDPSLPRTLGGVEVPIAIVAVDAPSERPVRRVITLRTFASPSRGQALFETRCIGCHERNGQGVGPILNGVVGREAGSLMGFPYSQALRDFDKRWTYKLLLSWLTDTQALVPGTKMRSSIVATLSDQQRHDLIAYLESISRR